MTAVTEVCPGCKKAHNGFTPRPEQHRAFWQCRQCGALLVTLKRPNGEWFVDFLLNQDLDTLHMAQRHDVVAELIRLTPDQKILWKILRVMEDAADYHKFFDGLGAIKPEKT